MSNLENCSFCSIFFLLIPLFMVQEVKGQERRLLEGKIVIDSVQNIKDIHVVNLTAESGTTTNDKGEFKMMAGAGDTIFISSVQFENRTLVIRETDFGEIFLVKLIEKFNELDEVQLDNIKLSGVLSGDITRLPRSNYEKLGWPFPKPKRSSLEIAIQSANGGGPLISILNTLNGKKEQLEKAQKNNEISILVNKGLDLVGESFFIYELNIEEEEIMNFLFFCSEDTQYEARVLSKNTLQFVEFLKSKIDSFKEWRELD